MVGMSKGLVSQKTYEVMIFQDGFGSIIGFLFNGLSHVKHCHQIGFVMQWKC